MSQNTQRTPPALRFVIVSAVTGVPGDSLDQLNSAPYPDGSLFSVAITGAIYRLDKTSTAAAQEIAIVAPLAGPGRFVYVTGGSTNPVIHQTTGTAALAASAAFAETANTWTAFPSGANFYVSTVPGLFTLNTTTGIVTYNGASEGTFRISLSATLSSATAAQAIELAPSISGAHIGTGDFIGHAGVANVPPTTANLGIELSSSLVTGFSHGDTIQAIAKDDTGSNNITVSRLNLIIAPA